MYNNMCVKHNKYIQPLVMKSDSRDEFEVWFAYPNHY